MGGGIGRREPRALSEPVGGCAARNIDHGCDMSDVRPQGSLCQPSEAPASSMMVASITSTDQGGLQR